MFFFTTMKKQSIEDFKIAIILTLKQLRKEKGNISQASFNADIFDKTGFTHNIGRNQVEGNFNMETLFIYSIYFEITLTDFFQRVNEVFIEDIVKFKEEKINRKNKKDA